MRNRMMAAVLALCLGGLGFHKFYLGEGGKGILYLLCCPLLIPAFLAFFEATGLVCMTDDQFDHRYNPQAFTRITHVS